MDLKKVKPKYDAMTLDQIEKAIKGSLGTIAEQDREAIRGLFYLERHNRHKDNPKYRKAPFSDYLMDIYSIRYKTYYNKRLAYSNFEKAAMEHGTGLITAIKTKCGVNKIETVLKAISKKEKVLKTPIRRDQISDIIQAHRKPKKEKPVKIDWESRCEAKDKALIEERRENKELREQNTKLKARVIELERYQEIEQAIKPFMFPEVEETHSISEQ